MLWMVHPATQRGCFSLLFLCACDCVMLVSSALVLVVLVPMLLALGHRNRYLTYLTTFPPLQLIPFSTFPFPSLSLPGHPLPRSLGTSILSHPLLSRTQFSHTTPTFSGTASARPLSLHFSLPFLSISREPITNLTPCQ